jgi:hypothetical protein
MEYSKQVFIKVTTFGFFEIFVRTKKRRGGMGALKDGAVDIVGWLGAGKVVGHAAETANTI